MIPRAKRIWHGARCDLETSSFLVKTRGNGRNLRGERQRIRRDGRWQTNGTHHACRTSWCGNGGRCRCATCQKRNHGQKCNSLICALLDGGGCRCHSAGSISTACDDDLERRRWAGYFFRCSWRLALQSLSSGGRFPARKMKSPQTRHPTIRINEHDRETSAVPAGPTT